MKPMVTNIYSQLKYEGEAGFSTVVIERTLAAPYRISHTLTSIVLSLAGRTNMPQETIYVYDGLLELISVSPAESQVTIELALDQPAAYRVREEQDIPCRLVVDIDRSCLKSFFLNRRIAIDPGHGGSDSGFSGPVNLREKDVVLDISRLLCNLLSAAGAAPVLARTDDTNPALAKRYALSSTAEIYIGIHLRSQSHKNSRGYAVKYNSNSPRSLVLARLIQQKLAQKTHLQANGIDPYQFFSLGSMPAVIIEAVTITNWVEEGLLRSPTFRMKIAQGIFNGLAGYLRQRQNSRPVLKQPALSPAKNESPAPDGKAGQNICIIPLRTHVISAQDDLRSVIDRYTHEIAEPGDVIVLAESMVAITQGRAIAQRTVRPGLLASFLCRFPGKDGSLATPFAMQLAIRESGVLRILLGAAVAAVGRLIGRRGDFYRIAGRHLALIDDVAGTMWPFESSIILGPKNPGKLTEKLKQDTGLDVAIVDVNDIKCVDILAATSGVDVNLLQKGLYSNPLGNDDQQTPIAVLKNLVPGE